MAAAIIFISVSPAAEAQDALQDSIQSLSKQTTELKAMVEDMRAETTALRRELEATRQELSAAVPQAREAASPLQSLEEEQQLLSAKVEEQYQQRSRALPSIA
jgi:chromosome segregation ATPase